MRLRNAVVVDGARTAFCKGGRGKLEAARLDDVGAFLIQTLLERNPKVKLTMIEYQSGNRTAYQHGHHA
jgi:acetyl-CoA acetyltransferase